MMVYIPSLLQGGRVGSRALGQTESSVVVVTECHEEVRRTRDNHSARKCNVELGEAPIRFGSPPARTRRDLSEAFVGATILPFGFWGKLSAALSEGRKAGCPLRVRVDVARC